MPPPPLYIRRRDGAPDSLRVAGLPESESSGGDGEGLLITTLAELPIEPDTQIATTPRGRFVGLGDGIDHSGPVRDALLALSPDPEVERFRRLRAITLAAPVSWAMVVVANGREVSDLARDAQKVVESPAFKAAENDPETAALAKARHERIDKAVTMRKVYVGIEGAVALVALLVTFAGLRRFRGVLVAVGAGAAGWWFFHAGASGRCFKTGAWRDLLLALFGAVGAVTALVLAPSETSVAKSLRARLGLPARTPSADPMGFRKELAALIMAAWAGLTLPFFLDLLRRVVNDRVRAAIFILFCLGCFLGALAFRKEQTRVAPRASALLLAAALGFGVTVAADIASRATFGAIVEVQTCVAPESAKKLRAVQEQSGKETTSARKDTQTDSLAWFIAVLAAPLSEEMLYRGTLQRVARRALGSRWAMLISSVIFGLAHSFAFKNAFYQHIGLGLAFAAVFEIGGGGAVAVVASAATHALWNLWLASMPVF